MAIPQYVDDTNNIVTSANASNTINYPATSKQGDLLLLNVLFYKSTTGVFTVATPSGWTLLETQDQSSALGKHMTLFWRFRGAETSVTVTASTGTGMLSEAQIQAWKGDIDQATPVVSASSFSNTSATAHTVPSVTAPDSDFAMAGFHFGSKSSTINSAITNSWTAQMYEKLDTQSYLNSHNTMMTNAVEYALYGSGATGTRTVTSSAATIGNFMATVGIKSAKTGPTVRGDNTTMNSNSPSANLVATYPGGDYFIIVSCFRKTTAGAFTTSISDPTNFTLLASSDNSAADGSRLDVWGGWRAGGATSVTVSASTGTGMLGMLNIVTVPDDGQAVDKGEPYGDVQIVYGNTSATSTTIPASTTTVDMSLSQLVTMVWNASATTAPANVWSPPPWHAEGSSVPTAETSLTWNGTRGMTQGSALDYQEVAGSTGTASVNHTQSCNPRYGVRVIIQPPHPNLKGPDDDQVTGADNAVVGYNPQATDTAAGADVAGTVKVGTAVDVSAGADTASTKLAAADVSNAGADNAAVAANVPAPDTASGVDTATVLVVTPAADVSSGLDTATVRMTGADTGAGADIAAVPAGFDTGTGVDNAPKIIVASDDPATATDSAFSSNTVVTPDAALGTDSASVKVSGAADTGSGSDNAITLIALDTGSGLDNASKVIVASDDPATGTDTAFASNTAQVGDTSSGVDTATVRITGAADTGAGVDSSVGFASDTATGVDTASVRIPADEPLSSLEAAASTNTAQTADTGSSADTAKVIFVVGDTGSGVDNAVGFGQDTATGVEGTATLRTAATETSPGVDTAAVAASSAAATDVGAGVDNSITRLPVSDASNLSVDNANLNAQAATADTASGADTAKVIILATGDTGTGTETITLRFSVADTGTAVDNGQIAVFVFASDTIGSVDDGLRPVATADTISSVEAASKAVSGFLDNPRVVKIEKDNRVVRIVRENRTAVVEPDFRKVFIGYEDRRVIRVESEERYVRIPREV
jgi:hypothetical protein